MVSIILMDKFTETPHPVVRYDRAFEHFGSYRVMAEFFGITPEAVMNWKRERRVYLPETRALQIALSIPQLVEAPVSEGGIGCVEELSRKEAVA